MSLWTTFIISILATILSVVAAMIILAYAGNKVEGIINPTITKADTFASAIPVSYTHLDVYKRQA